MIKLNNSPILERTIAEINFPSSDFAIQSYPDEGTIILRSMADSQINFKITFEPDYIGSSYEGEYYFSDDQGGCYFYPERHDAGFTFQQINTKEYFYEFSAGQRAIIAEFPVREKPEWTTRFLQSWGCPKIYVSNEEKEQIKTISEDLYNRINTIYSQSSNLTYETTAKLQSWVGQVDVINMMEHGYNISPFFPFYPKSSNYAYQNFVTACHDNGLKAIAYINGFRMFFDDMRFTWDDLKNRLVDIVEQYNVDGFYIDYLKTDYSDQKIHNNIENFLFSKWLRETFPDKFLVWHNTHHPHGEIESSEMGSILTPNTELFYDLIITGEGVHLTDGDLWAYRGGARKWHNNTLYLSGYHRSISGQSFEEWINFAVEEFGVVYWMPGSPNHSYYKMWLDAVENSKNQ